MKAYMIGNNQQYRDGARGFTLFYALLVDSLALDIGTSIFDITLREIELSNAATQSQYAVYVADSGAECALYWDSKYKDGSGNLLNGGSGSAFSTSTSDTQSAGAGAQLWCNAVDVTTSNWIPVSIANAATTTFTVMGTPIPSKNNQTPCAIVYVAKVGNPSVTTITSHGYNTCVSGSLQLERVFQVSY
jgi:hypothetical protein